MSGSDRRDRVLNLQGDGRSMCRRMEVTLNECLAGSVAEMAELAARNGWNTASLVSYLELFGY